MFIWPMKLIFYEFIDRYNFSSMKLQDYVCMANVFGKCEKMVEIPIPSLSSVSGFYLAHFFIRNNFPFYPAFVVIRSLMVMRFVLQKFWDNIWLVGISLNSFDKLIVANVLITDHSLSKVGLSCHALLLCYIENDDVRYLSYMVIMATLVGFALLRKVSMVAYSVWFCHETIFEALQWWNGQSVDGISLNGFMTSNFTWTSLLLIWESLLTLVAEIGRASCRERVLELV